MAIIISRLWINERLFALVRNAIPTSIKIRCEKAKKTAFAFGEKAAFQGTSITYSPTDLEAK